MVRHSLAGLVVRIGEVVLRIQALDSHSSRMEVEEAYHPAYCFAGFHTSILHLEVHLLRSNCSEDLILDNLRHRVPMRQS